MIAVNQSPEAVSKEIIEQSNKITLRQAQSETFLRSPNNISFIPPSGINSQTQSSSNVFIAFHKKSALTYRFGSSKSDGISPISMYAT